jgi:hypothetical protein
MMSPSCWGPVRSLDEVRTSPSHHGIGMMSRSKLLTYWHLRFTMEVTFVLKGGIRKSARVAPLCE